MAMGREDLARSKSDPKRNRYEKEDEIMGMGRIGVRGDKGRGREGRRTRHVLGKESRATLVGLDLVTEPEMDHDCFGVEGRVRRQSRASAGPMAEGEEGRSRC